MSTRVAPQQQATLWLVVTPTRYLVRWYAGDSRIWHDILNDLRGLLPRHRDICYRGASRTWSIPRTGRHRTLLVMWITTWFPPGSVTLAAEDGLVEYRPSLEPMKTTYKR